MGRRSFSQYTTYTRCPEAYRLQKIAKIPEPPCVWLPAGTAGHSACDAIDEGKSIEEAVVGFVDQLDEELGRMEEEFEVGRSTFRTTGVTKAMPLGKDQIWWNDNIEGMLRSYAEWRETSGYEIATINGRPAIEVEFDLNLGHGTTMKGFIDRVFVRPDGDLEVIDLKFGQHQPGPYQLPTYAYALRIMYDLEVNWGSFFMVAKNGHSTPKDLTYYGTRGTEIQETYRRLDEAIEAGFFVPNITSDCFRCPVKDFCKFT